MSDSVNNSVFRQASSMSYLEAKDRELAFNRVISFGIEFLDDALGGIYPDDLVLIGAGSGAGKSQLCCNIALANLEDGKKVHYIALEASEYEIVRRLKFPHVLERFYSDLNRPKLADKLTYTDWLTGRFAKELEPYNKDTDDFFAKGYTDLFLYKRLDSFNIDDLIKTVIYCSDDTDLIIIDHVHYFDFDDDNENRAIKNIAKTVRHLALDLNKPIILVSHLRKKDKANEDLVAGLDEFHGSSDLYKIATKVITLSPGSITHDGLYETYFRIPKNRMDGGVTRYIAKELFNPRINNYERKRYQLAYSSNCNRKEGFKPLDTALIPKWARRCDKSCIYPAISHQPIRNNKQNTSKRYP